MVQFEEDPFNKRPTKGYPDSDVVLVVAELATGLFSTRDRQVEIDGGHPLADVATRLLLDAEKGAGNFEVAGTLAREGKLPLEVIKPADPYDVASALDTYRERLADDGHPSADAVFAQGIVRALVTRLPRSPED